MKRKLIFLFLLFMFVGYISIIKAETEPPINQPESDIPDSAPTNKSYVINLLDKYKTAIENKDVDKYLSCFSKSFSKEIIEINRSYTNKFFLTYPDIEKGVREDNFSKYKGKTCKIKYIIKDLKFNLMNADVLVDIIIQITDSQTVTEKKEEKFKLLWDKDRQKWEIVSF